MLLNLVPHAEVARPEARRFSFFLNPCWCLLLDLRQQLLLYDLLLGILLINDAQNRWQTALLCNLFLASVIICTNFKSASFVCQQISLTIFLITAEFIRLHNVVHVTIHLLKCRLKPFYPMCWVFDSLEWQIRGQWWRCCKRLSIQFFS
jgi:hypothetical protein